MKRPRNHYDNLKVDRKATADEIKKAYRRLSSLHHPDKNGGSAKSVQAMKCINAAYEILSNPAKRAAHDAWIERSQPAPKPQSTYSSTFDAQYRASSAQREAKWNAWEKEFDAHADAGAKAESHSGSKDQHHAEDGFKDFFGYGFDSSFGSWRSSEPQLRSDHRPKNLDEKHLDEFTKFNDLMRRKLNGIHLEYVTPELIYRAFIIDKRRGRAGPSTLDKAYKSLGRALKSREDSFVDKVASILLDRSPFLQGVVGTVFVFSLAAICLLAFV